MFYLLYYPVFFVRLPQILKNCMLSRFSALRKLYSTIGLKREQMNVLVYSGPGTTSDSVKHCLETFRQLLSPYYAVYSVDAKTIINQPWASKTSLLVIPGGADLPLCRLFNGETNSEIIKFVRKGGKFVGFCSGGYYGSGRCEFEVGNRDMEVSGTRELKFFPGIARGCAYKGFDYETEAGARAATLNVNNAILPDVDPTVVNYYNGGPVFVDAQNYPNTQILAAYTDPLEVEDGPTSPHAAVILCDVGQGKALLTGTHPEFTPILLKESPNNPTFTETIKVLHETSKQRIHFLRSCLKKMGLKVNESDDARPSLTPLYMFSIDCNKAHELLNTLKSNIGYKSDNLMDVGGDIFRWHKSLPESIYDVQQREGYEDPDEAIKDVVLCDTIPDRKVTNYFNLPTFYKTMVYLWNQNNINHPNRFGSLFVYGEVLTSTSVLMEKNYTLLRHLPDGFTIYGTTQVSGRGRSGNVWVNPPGVVAVSTLMKIAISNSKRSPIVFIQYIASLAFIEAILNYEDSGSYSNIPVKIKWPNDIYILKPEHVGSEISEHVSEPIYAKIGGILINTNIIDDQYFIIAGCGINISNNAPTTSVNLVIEKMNDIYGTKLSPISHERFLAKFLTIFDQMIYRFKLQGFDPFLDLYYRRWLHNGQIVRIRDDGNVRAKVVGISKDWGMLLARSVDNNGHFNGGEYELQPDGNSFDMFTGMISRKK